MLLLLIMAVALIGNGQSKSDKIYDTFRGKEGVAHFSFSKSMLDAVDLDLGDDDEKNISGNLHEVRFLSYNPGKGDLKGSEFIQKAVKLLPAQYRQFEGDSEDAQDAEIWLLGKKKKFKECHVFVKNEKEDQMRFVVSFYGDFTVSDLDKLKCAGKDFSGN